MWAGPVSSAEKRKSLAPPLFVPRTFYPQIRRLPGYYYDYIIIIIINELRFQLHQYHFVDIFQQLSIFVHFSIQYMRTQCIATRRRHTHTHTHTNFILTTQSRLKIYADINNMPLIKGSGNNSKFVLGFFPLVHYCNCIN